MKVAIIGYGFVGKALSDGFLDSVEVLKIDPKLNTKLNQISKFKPEITFICLPTPMSNDSSQDISIVKKTMKEILQLDINSLIVLKSTILPDNIQELSMLTNEFIYNPEFLREKHAKEDFINSSLIIFGGEKEKCKNLGNFYSNYTKCLSNEYFYTDMITASFIKYSINSFLSTKVSFFNELHRLFLKSGSKDNWENFIEMISKDKRIGDSHMQVPGHDGRFGFGGACLPKDSKAFSLYSEKNEAELHVLKTAINTNNKIRAKYNKKTNREIEQNINFDGDS
jgi:UDPglucose 6-dehydrogenase